MKYYIEETLPNGKRDYWIVDVQTLEQAQEIADKKAYSDQTRIDIGTEYDHIGLLGKSTLCHRGLNGKWINHKEAFIEEAKQKGNMATFDIYQLKDIPENREIGPDCRHFAHKMM